MSVIAVVCLLVLGPILLPTTTTLRVAIDDHHRLAAATTTTVLLAATVVARTKPSDHCHLKDRRHCRIQIAVTILSVPRMAPSTVNIGPTVAAVLILGKATVVARDLLIVRVMAAVLEKALAQGVFTAMLATRLHGGVGGGDHRLEGAIGMEEGYGGISKGDSRNDDDDDDSVSSERDCCHRFPVGTRG